MTYYRRQYSNRPPLTPPAELVSHFVKWRPKGTDGTRGATVYGTVRAFNGEARTLSIEVRQETSPWQPNPTRTVEIPLSHGPFTLC